MDYSLTTDNLLKITKKKTTVTVIVWVSHHSCPQQLCIVINPVHAN